MNNKKITSITLLGMTLAIAIIIPQAYAHDSKTSSMTLKPFNVDDGVQTIWYDTKSLAKVTLDGQSNTVGLRLTGEVSRAAIDTTNMNVTESTSYVPGTNSRFDAKQIGNALTFGKTSVYGTGTSMYKVIYLNTYDKLDYDTSAGCKHYWDLGNPQYTANHEFGHFAGLSHHSSWPFDNTHTAMKEGCNPGQAQLRTEDISDINDWYN